MPEFLNEQHVHRAVAGDAQALADLLADQAAALRASVHIDAKWSGQIEIEDVLQVTFMEAFLKIRDFDARQASAFGGWLRQLALNNLRDVIRALSTQKRRPPGARLFDATGDASPPSILEVIAVASTTPSRELAMDEARRAVERAILRLPPSYAQVVRLIDLEERSAEEAARLMQKTRASVYMMRTRAHEHLQRILGAESQFFSK